MDQENWEILGFQLICKQNSSTSRKRTYIHHSWWRNHCSSGPPSFKGTLEREPWRPRIFCGLQNFGGSNSPENCLKPRFHRSVTLTWPGLWSRQFWEVKPATNMGMDQYLLIPFLGGWTSINPSYFDVNRRGTLGFDTLPYDVYGFSMVLVWLSHRGIVLLITRPLKLEWMSWQRPALAWPRRLRWPRWTRILKCFKV